MMTASPLCRRSTSGACPSRALRAGPWTTAISLALAAVAGHAAPQRPLAGKQILKWGWDTPSTAYVRDHWREMDQRPFDGVVFDPELTKPGTDEKTGALAWQCWGPRRLRRDELAWATANLKSAKFRNLRTFFLRFNVSPGTVGWFDDFDPVLHNAGLAADMAAELGYNGLLLDVEHYSKSQVFSYGVQNSRRPGSFAEYRRQVRLRGRQFAQTVCAVLPTLELFLTFGHELAVRQTGKHRPLQDISYALLPAFLDGVLEGLSDEAMMIDGYEYSYGYDSARQFESAVEVVKQGMLKHTAVPELYAKKVRIGFGLWIDNGGRKNWSTEDTSRNYFSPEGFAWALHLALKHSDKYVWVYSHNPNAWTGAKMTEAYWQAYRDARRADLPGPPEYRGNRLSRDGKPRSAKDYPGYSDKETFAEILKTHEKLADAPRTWEFRLDPQEAGVKEEWFATVLPEGKLREWKPIKIGEWWEPQGHAHDGYAWYRVSLPVPAATPGRKLFLAFGAVDESAWVYADGKLVHEHDMGESGWKTPFLVDLAEAVRGKEKVQLTVRALDRIGMGGIWKNVIWVTGKQR